MRYVEGSGLRSLLAGEGRLEVGRALALVDHGAAALDAAHARGLVHRDVKPGNDAPVHRMSGSKARA
jgi:serine/threonine-protein kinase